MRYFNKKFPEDFNLQKSLNDLSKHQDTPSTPMMKAELHFGSEFSADLKEELEDIRTTIIDSQKSSKNSEYRDLQKGSYENQTSRNERVSMIHPPPGNFDIFASSNNAILNHIENQGSYGQAGKTNKSQSINPNVRASSDVSNMQLDMNSPDNSVNFIKISGGMSCLDGSDWASNSNKNVTSVTSTVTAGRMRDDSRLEPVEEIKERRMEEDYST